MSWVRYDDGFHNHPKVMEAKLADPASLALHVLAGTWSASTSTPGIVSLAGAVAQAGTRAKALRWAGILVTAGLWHAAGHQCERCVQPPEGSYRIHDWEVTNPVRDVSEIRSAAGKKGAAARWGAKQADDNADAAANGKRIANDAPVPGPVPEAPTTDVVAARDDVERVCEHLADRIEANGSSRPTIGATWRTAARLLIDRDHRTEAQVHAAIDWCQADPFWRANVLSMPTLREKYDQLRLAAERTRPAQPVDRFAGAMGRALAAEARA